MVIRTGPSPLCWLVGVELARHRNTARMSMAQASTASGISKPKLGHLETGRQHQTRDDIARLLAAYRSDPHDVNRLVSLTERAEEATWWAPWAQVVPDWLATFVGLEGLAEREFIFEPLIIPGLFQTEDYARATTADTPRVRRDHGDRFVALRMARTRRLADPDHPLHVDVVVTEAALRLRVGSPQVRRAQLEHLVALSERDNVSIQVLRPEDGLHTAMAGQFVLLDFTDVRSIAYAELHDGAVYVQDTDQVHTYALTEENVRHVALGPDQSVALIQSMIAALEDGP